MRLHVAVLAFAAISTLGAGCVARESAPAAVALPPPSAVAIAASGASLPCTIMGDGELVEDDHADVPEFGLFATARSTDAELVVDDTKAVAVAWSGFPPAHEPGASPIAAVALGGQARIAVHAFAKLTGRGFQLRTTGEIAGEQMWIDRGVAVEVLGWSHGNIAVRRSSGFESPAYFEAAVPCGMMAYDPKAIDPPRSEEADDPMAPIGDHLELRRSPGGATFVDVRPGDYGLGLAARESSGDWLHVRWHERGLGLDGWVKKSEVEEGGYGGLGLSGYGSSGGKGRPMRVVTVTRATALLLGDDHHRFGDAVFEPGAVLDVWAAEGDLLSVTLQDESIRANDGLWIASKAVADR